MKMKNSIYFLILSFPFSSWAADSWNYNLSKYAIESVQIRGFNLRVEPVSTLEEGVFLSAPSSDFQVLVKGKTLSVEDRRLSAAQKPLLTDLSEKVIRLKMKPRKTEIVARKLSVNSKNWSAELSLTAVQGSFVLDNTGLSDIYLQKGQIKIQKTKSPFKIYLGEGRIVLSENEFRGEIQQIKGQLELSDCKNCDLKMNLYNVRSELKKYKGKLQEETFEGSQDLQFEPDSRIRLINKKASIVFRGPAEKNVELNLKTTMAELFVPPGYRPVSEAQGYVFRTTIVGEAEKSALHVESDQGRIVFKFKE